MTKEEFLSKIPTVIQHRAWGIAKVEISMDAVDKKGACYRLTNRKATCRIYGSTWSEVYNKLINYLKGHGLYNK